MSLTLTLQNYCEEQQSLLVEGIIKQFKYVTFIIYYIFSRNFPDLPQIKSFSLLKTKCFNPKNYRTYKMSRKWHIMLCHFILRKSHIE